MNRRAGRPFDKLRAGFPDSRRTLRLRSGQAAGYMGRQMGCHLFTGQDLRNSGSLPSIHLKAGLRRW
jgi:hypothetical protein